MRGGDLDVQDDQDIVVDPMEGDSPYNGSKSLVTGKKGFSPHCTALTPFYSLVHLL